MSKSPNLFLPAIGVTAMVLGVAFGVSTRNYKADEAELARLQAERAAERAEAKAAEVAELEAEIAAVQEAAREELRLAALSGGAAGEPAPVRESGFGLGRDAHPDEIAAWDVDVLPDGRGLPVGSGDVWTGEEVFVDQCAACHGDFAEGVDNWPVLAGGFDTLAKRDPVKTVGSYWPYLSTVFDYVHRSMPFGAAGTLTADETYAITAYILYSNNLVDDDFVLSNENFTEVEMYNADGFVVDDRAELEYPEWRTEPCMENCKDEVEITMRTVFLVETPPEGGSNSVMNPAREVALPSFTAEGPSFIPEAPAPVEEAALRTESAEPEVDGGSTLVAEGEKIFRQCSTCHEVGPGARNKTGPHLNALMGRVMGSVDGFRNSGGFQSAMAEGKVWDEVELAAFLDDPKGYMSGTKMAFRGLKSDEEHQAIAAYLAAASE